MRYACVQPGGNDYSQWGCTDPGLDVHLYILYINIPGNTYTNNIYVTTHISMQLRKTLLDNDCFGLNSQLELRQLLGLAYTDFRNWCKVNRVRSSQRRFTPKLLLKKMHGAYLSCKAHNGRVVLQWLAERSTEFARNGSGDARMATQAVALCPGFDHHVHVGIALNLR